MGTCPTVQEKIWRSSR